MTPGYLTAALICALATAALLRAEHRQRQSAKWLYKPLAALAFITAALFTDALATPYGRVILIGLVLSAIGDVCLIPRRTGPAFLAGLGAFLLAHVAYATAFVLRGLDLTTTLTAALPLALIALLTHRWLAPKVQPALARPVVVYILVICTMAALAIGTHGHAPAPLIPLAATLFVLSDLSVARDRFDDAGFTNRLWGVPLYFAAQLLFAASALPSG